MARRKTNKAPLEPYVETFFLYPYPYDAEDRLSTRQGPFILKHPLRLSKHNAELAIRWLELAIDKIRALGTDELERCSVCDRLPAKLWQRDPELLGYCAPCAPQPHHIMSGRC